MILARDWEADVKGDKRILDLLNEVLTGELTAASQYFLHAKMCKNWGYDYLGGKIYKESIEEMKHADKLVERILFLEGLPNLQKLGSLAIGQGVAEILESDLSLERATVPRLNVAVTLCRDVGDNGSEELLLRILVDSEGHVDWLESQVELIKQIGEQHYFGPTDSRVSAIATRRARNAAIQLERDGARPLSAVDSRWPDGETSEAFRLAVRTSRGDVFHYQARDGAAGEQVPLDDLRYVVGGHATVEDGVGVDEDSGPERARAQAAGARELVVARGGQLSKLFEKGAIDETSRPGVTRSPRIADRAILNAYEDTPPRGHDSRSVQPSCPGVRARRSQHY